MGGPLDGLDVDGLRVGAAEDGLSVGAADEIA